MEIMEISKADWKVYRERVSDWQEHYICCTENSGRDLINH